MVKHKTTRNFQHFLINGRYARGMPRAVLARFTRRFGDKPHTSTTVREIIGKVHKLFPLTGYRTTTRNVRLSRLVPVRRILQLHLYTCGALASVHAAVLRHLGYPTRLVDGRVKHYGKWGRHAWIEVFLPKTGRFIPFDPMENGNRVGRHHRRALAYRDWSELKLKP